MEWEETLRPLVLKVAEPELNVPVPRVVAPSLKVTVPVGVPLPGAVAVTVAVNVTDWPETEGLAEEARAVERSEEHTSELQSHSFISYAVFCLKKKKTN